MNRPVEALHNYQKAIELNDNRAIYRSKLLLDSDLAARQSSLARIYNNLGFQQRGLVEGWQSVNTDPSNFSAHRFLSDSYAALPRHEIARVSELLQSQLLQPINITPIQPRLAESNLFLIGSQGPSIAGFNTYNPLFNRNQAVLQADGLVGSNSTWGAEGIASGIYDKCLGAAATPTSKPTGGEKTLTRMMISSMSLPNASSPTIRAFRLNTDTEEQKKGIYYSGSIRITFPRIVEKKKRPIQYALASITPFPQGPISSAILCTQIAI